MDGQVIRLSDKPPKSFQTKDAMSVRDLERKGSFDGNAMMM